MSTTAAEQLPTDPSQWLIDNELARLEARLASDRQEGHWDSEIIKLDDSAWVTYLRPGTDDGPAEDAIYFLDIGRIKPAYAVVWSKHLPAAVFSADGYSLKYNESSKYSGTVPIGFDLSEDCEWQPVTDDETKASVAELLEAVPAQPAA